MRRNYLAPQVAYLVEQPIAPEEFDKRLSTPLSEDEARELQALIRWFIRRYPTAKQRLIYARRKFTEWTRPATIVERSK